MIINKNKNKTVLNSLRARNSVQRKMAQTDTYYENQSTCVSTLYSYRSFSIGFFYYWATPGRTAIPGRPVARAEQAPGISPMSKNQFNIIVARKPRIRY